MQLPIPQDLPALRRALGLFSHYSCWILQYSEKIQPLTKVVSFPLSSSEVDAFEALRHEVAQATLSVIDHNIPFEVETDASEYAIAATLSQEGRPVAFFSRTLNKSELKHSSVEKEAYAIVEPLRKWRHLLIGKPFKLITDQKSVSFMLNSHCKGKVKNEKIARWRLEFFQILGILGKASIIMLFTDQAV